MKNIVKMLLSNLKNSIVFYIAGFGFLITLFFPDINTRMVTISKSWLVIGLLFIISFAEAVWRTFCTFHCKKFEFIDIKKTEQGNDIYWFKSDYYLNVGDTVKVVELYRNGVDVDICIAKVQRKNEEGHIGLLALDKTMALDNIKNNDNVKLKPVHISSDDIANLMKEMYVSSKV